MPNENLALFRSYVAVDLRHIAFACLIVCKCLGAHLFRQLVLMSYVTRTSNSVLFQWLNSEYMYLCTICQDWNRWTNERNERVQNCTDTHHMLVLSRMVDFVRSVARSLLWLWVRCASVILMWTKHFIYNIHRVIYRSTEYQDAVSISFLFFFLSFALHIHFSWSSISFLFVLLWFAVICVSVHSLRF